jgi:hypothetical protein
VLGDTPASLATISRVTVVPLDVAVIRRSRSVRRIVSLALGCAIARQDRSGPMACCTGERAGVGRPVPRSAALQQNAAHNDLIALSLRTRLTKLAAVR